MAEGLYAPVYWKLSWMMRIHREIRSQPGSVPTGGLKQEAAMEKNIWLVVWNIFYFPIYWE